MMRVFGPLNSSTMIEKNLCTLLLLIYPVLGSYYNHQMNLLHNLTDSSRYNRKIVPMEDMDSPLPIDGTVSIGDYIEVHENNQAVLLDLWLEFYWRDHKLTWNSSEYGNITTQRVDLNEIWHPHILLNFGTDYGNSFNFNSQVSVSNSGDVFLRLILSTKIRCFLDVSKFPFDEQSCTIYILPINALKTEAYFRNFTTHVKTVGEGQWDILSHGSSKVERSNISFVEFDFVIRRRPSYYVIYVMLPIFATSLLNPMVFLISSESGEKISTAVTILLSYSVFLGVISDVLARTSTSISVLSVYIVCSQVLSGIYVLLSVLILRRHNNLDQHDRLCFRMNGQKNRVRDTKNELSAPKAFSDSNNDAGRLDRICARVAFSLILILTIALLVFILS